jgi:outer membrane protein
MSADARGEVARSRRAARGRGVGWAAAAGIAGGLAASTAGATSLYDAIRLAYDTNPTLRAQRAELAAVGEGYVQARSNLGPQVAINGQEGYQGARVQAGAGLFTPRSDTSYRGATGQADLSIVQPLFTAGAGRAQVRSAQQSVLAGREDLRQSENETIQKVIAAYTDVRRDRQILGILRDEIDNLTSVFAEAKAKGELGELTRTDVAESEARLLSAEAQLVVARGRLTASDAEYLAVVGENPDELEPEPELPGVPASLDEAFAASDQNNPQIRSALNAERAAREKVNAAKSAYGPTVSLRFDAGVSPIEPYIPGLYDRSVTIAAVVSQPIFTAGMNASKVREAADRDSQAMLDIEAARRGVVQTIAQAWGQWTAARAATGLKVRQVDVERVAVEGNQVEERVGRRSIFELTNLEVELASARIDLLQSRHDEYSARASLLGAMGLLEVRYLTPGVTPYDPAAGLKRAAKADAVPWTAAVQRLDGVIAPHTAAPAVGAPGAGSTRPVADPAAGPHERSESR